MEFRLLITAIAAGRRALRRRSLGISLAAVFAIFRAVCYRFVPFSSGVKAAIPSLFFAAILGFISLYGYRRTRRVAAFEHIGRLATLDSNSQ